MFSHVMLGANDVDKSRAFYDAVLGALGAKSGRVDDKGRVYYTHNGGLFMISKPIDGEADCHANRGTVGFAGASPEAADAWHAGALACGEATFDEPQRVDRRGLRHALLALYVLLCWMARLVAYVET